jgi:protein-disulfide isomerase
VCGVLAAAPGARSAEEDRDAAILKQLEEIQKELRALRGEVAELKQSLGDAQRAAAVRPAPAPPAVPERVSMGDDPVLGSLKAPLALVEFSEFQCPFCRRFHEETLPKLKESYIDTGRLRYVFRDFPLLAIHPHAKAAAVAAHCAGSQDAYWRMHDALFANQKRLGPDLYDELARSLNLDLPAFQACVKAPEAEKEVTADMAEAASLGVQGTPHFFLGRVKDGAIVDVRRINGAQPLTSFTQVIEELSK